MVVLCRERARNFSQEFTERKQGQRLYNVCDNTNSKIKTMHLRHAPVEDGVK